MTRRKGPLPSPDTFPDLLLTFVALSGELPSALVSRLPGSDSYKAYAVKILKREKLLRTYYHENQNTDDRDADPHTIQAVRESESRQNTGQETGVWELR